MAAPGKHFRQGLTLVEAVRRFSDAAAVERLFIEARWPDGIRCPACASDAVAARRTGKPAPYRCRACRKDFSIKTGTVMQGSNLPLETWALAAYLMTTNLKGVSSMKLHRDLGITQKSAWHLAHRIRRAWEENRGPFAGPVEVDETYVGGKEGNKPLGRRTPGAGGGFGKAIVAGVKDRPTNRVSAAVVTRTDSRTLKGFVGQRIRRGAAIYTDDHAAYRGLPNHTALNHSVSEYVRGQAHTNGVESFWSLMKRGYHGTYHHMSRKHLGRYVTEFAGRHNDRPADTLDQVRHLARGLVGKRLRYRDLIR